MATRLALLASGGDPGDQQEGLTDEEQGHDVRSQVLSSGKGSRSIVVLPRPIDGSLSKLMHPKVKPLFVEFPGGNLRDRAE